MSTAQLLVPPLPTWFDNNGLPLAGGLMYTYQAGTTTPLATYTDETAVTPNANPVVLDSAGRGAVWLSSSAYKIILKTSAGVTLWTADNISSINPGWITQSMLASNTSISTVMTALYTRVVGSTAQVTANVATDTTITAAIAACISGNSILILPGTYSESPTIATTLSVFGTGQNCIVSGAITFASGSNYSLLKGIRTTSDITLNSGTIGNIVEDVFLASGKTFVDNGTSNFVQGTQET